jgi:hypothetical protein
LHAERNLLNSKIDSCVEEAKFSKYTKNYYWKVGYVSNSMGDSVIKPIVCVQIVAGYKLIQLWTYKHLLFSSLPTTHLGNKIWLSTCKHLLYPQPIWERKIDYQLVNTFSRHATIFLGFCLHFYAGGF